MNPAVEPLPPLSSRPAPARVRRGYPRPLATVGLLLWCASLGNCYPRYFFEELPQVDRLTEDLAISSYLLAALLPGFASGATTPDYLYVTNPADATVSAFTLDALSGALSANGVASAQTDAFGLVADRGGSQLYVANTGANTISHFDIGANGALTSRGTTGAPATRPFDLARHPVLEVLYTTHFVATNQIQAHDRDGTTGTLSVADTENTPAGPADLALHPNGNILYTVYSGAEDIEWFTVDPTGVLSPRGFQSGGGGSAPAGAAVHPGGQFAYFSMSGLDQIRRYDIDTGNGDLSGLTNTPTLDGPGAIVLHPSGNFLYVACGGTANTVQAFAVDAGTGALSSIGSVSAGSGTNGIAMDSSGRFLYVAETGGPTVMVFGIDSASGTLNALGTSSIGAGGSHQVATVPVRF